MLKNTKDIVCLHVKINQEGRIAMKHLFVAVVIFIALFFTASAFGNKVMSGGENQSAKEPIVLTVWYGKINIFIMQTMPVPFSGSAELDCFVVTDSLGNVQNTSYADGTLNGWQAYYSEGLMSEEIRPVSRYLKFIFEGGTIKDGKIVFSTDFISDDSDDIVMFQGTILPNKRPFLGLAMTSHAMNGGVPLTLTVEPDGSKGEIASCHSSGQVFPPLYPGFYTFDMVIKSSGYDITEIMPSVYGTFVETLPVENELEVFVDWNGRTPDKVDFTLKQDFDSVDADNTGGKKKYDMGTLDGEIGTGGNNKVVVEAKDKGGNKTDPDNKLFGVVPMPNCGGISLGPISVEVIGKEAFYKSNIDFPNPPFEAKSGVPGFVPYIGGNEIGITSTQLHAAIGLSSLGKGYGEGKAKSGFYIANVEINGEIGGNVNLSLSPQKGWYFENGEAGINIKGMITKKANLFDLFPGLKQPLSSIPMLGTYLVGIADLVEVKAGIGPTVGVKGKFAQQGNEVNWTEGTGSGGVAMSVSAAIGDEDALKGEVAGEGSGVINIKIPPPYWGGGTLTLTLSATFTYAGMQIANVSDTWECNFKKDLDKHVSPTNFVWVPLTQYATAGSPKPMFSGKKIPLRNAMKNASVWEIINYVGADASPDIAMSGDKRAVVFVLEDPGNPEYQRREIMFSQKDPDGWWYDAERITWDYLDAFNPKVCYYKSDIVMAVWEGASDEGIVPAEPFDPNYMNTFEIFYSVRNPEDGVWSAPERISGDAVMDAHPKLEDLGNGKLMATWMSAAAGESEPEISIKYSIYDGTGWSEPKTAASGKSIGGVDFAADSSSGKAFIVYAQDADGSYETVNDYDIYLCEYDGTKWSASKKITDDSVPDVAPHVVARSGGESSIVWYRNGSLALTNDKGKHIGNIFENEGEIALQSLNVIETGTGNIMLLWQDLSGYTPQLVRRTIDINKPESGRTLDITQDENRLQGSPSVAIGENATDIAVAYISTQLKKDAKKETPFGERSICVAEDKLLADLSFDATNGLVFSPENPKPGDSAVVSASVCNYGDYSVNTGKLTLQVWDGEPDGADSVKIGEKTLSLPFDAGTSVTENFNWQVPGDNKKHKIVALIDTEGEVEESSETNNRIEKYTTLADLTFASVSREYLRGGDVNLNLAVKNIGSTANEAPYYIEIKNPADDSGLQVRVPIPVTLNPNDVYTTSTRVSRDIFDDADTTSVRAAIISSLAPPEEEFLTDNNAVDILLTALPDLFVNDAFIMARRPVAPNPQSAVLVYLFNRGSAPAPSGVQVKLYDGDPIAKKGAGELATITTTAALGQGETVKLEANVTIPEQCDLYVMADPAGLIPEIEDGNNLTHLKLDLSPTPTPSPTPVLTPTPIPTPTPSEQDSVLNALLGKVTLTPEQAQVVDRYLGNNDGVLDIADIVTIINSGRKP